MLGRSVEHPNSYGWDIASTYQGLYCDMGHKQLYVLCTSAIKDNCFDLATKNLIPKAGITARGGIPDKKYKTHEHWKVGAGRR